MAKEKLNKEEKFEKQDFNLFEALEALDKKDYRYYDRLSEDQQRKFSPYMMLMWLSMVKGNRDMQSYYVQSTEFHANKYIFNENISDHPKLQWLMLCSASPGIGKQFRNWIPNLAPSVTKLKTKAKPADVKDYFKKVYPGSTNSEIEVISKAYVREQNRKTYLASVFPDMKISDIEVLNEFVTDNDITQYEKESGNQ